MAWRAAERRAEGMEPGMRHRRGGRSMRALKRFVVTVVTLAVIVVIGATAAWLGTPSASDAPQRAAAQAKTYGIAFPGPSVPAVFSKALIATEDKRFNSESAVDPFAVIRLAVSRITGDKSDQGGATIQQQLAKMLYTPGQGGVSAELKQVIMAYKLDATFSKREILDLYAEVAYYGHGYYGLEKASCGYYGHPASDLTPEQGAMLAGAVNAPTYDDPINDPQQAYSRYAHVIGRMKSVGDITPDQAKQMLTATLGVVPRSEAGC